MTTYSTGNPLGSSDPRDLYDNAENLDNLVNGEQPAYSDRLGKSRRSWQSVEDQANQQAVEFSADQDDRASQFAAFIAASGYEFLGDYAAGIEITGYQQIVRDTNGEFWRVSGSTTLPYTTTGAGLPEGGAFVAVGDAVLRQELNSNTTAQGSDLIAHTGTSDTVTEALDKRTIYVGSVAELEALSLPVGTNVYLTQNGRAGEFVVKAGTPPSDPQKGIYIVLSNNNYAMRRYDGITPNGRVNIKWFGAVGDGVADDTDAIEGAFAAGTVIYVPTGQYLITRPLDETKKLRIVGDSNSINPGAGTSTLLKGSGVSGDLITLRANSAGMENLNVEGQDGNTGDGIVLLGGRQFLVNVSAFGMGRDGIRIGRDTTGPNCNLWKFENVKAKYNGRHGVNIDQESVSGGLWEANAGSFIDGDLQYNGEAGLRLGYAGFNTFMNLGCQDNGTYGLFASDNSQGHKFYGGDFEVNGRNGTSSTSFYDFYLSDLSKGNIVVGITCFNFPQTLYIGSQDNIVLGASSGQFAGDQQHNGLMLRNIESEKPTVLDYYEEGVFTPVVEGTTTAGSATYSTQAGKYTRIGNLVTFTVHVVYSGHTGTGNLTIAGLPFQTSGLWNYSISSSGITVSQYRYLVAYSNSASTDIQLRQTRTSVGASVGSTNLEDLPMGASGTIRISGSYTV